MTQMKAERDHSGDNAVQHPVRSRRTLRWKWIIGGVLGLPAGFWLAALVWTGFADSFTRLGPYLWIHPVCSGTSESLWLNGQRVLSGASMELWAEYPFVYGMATIRGRPEWFLLDLQRREEAVGPAAIAEHCRRRGISSAVLERIASSTVSLGTRTASRSNLVTAVDVSRYRQWNNPAKAAELARRVLPPAEP